MCFGQDTPDSTQKVVAIRIIGKKLSALNPSDDNVMERHGSIYSGFSWHIFHMSRALNPVNCKYVGRPQSPLFGIF
jgi:hypothetical protein